MVSILGSRGASAVMGLFMLALGSSEAPAQSLPAFDIAGAVKSLDVDASAKPLGAKPFGDQIDISTRIDISTQPAITPAASPASVTITLPAASVAAPAKTATAAAPVPASLPAATVAAPAKPASVATPVQKPSAVSAVSGVAAVSAVQPASVAAPVRALIQAPMLRAAAPISSLIPAGWAPTSMAALSSMLSSLVTASPADASLDPQLNCLATAVYFEARGEPIEGQLAVANVVINRAASGRYPPDWCGVVKQKAQFSFVRNGEFPVIDTASPTWARAQAVARIAAGHVLTALPQDVLWYHADYVAPKWRRNLQSVEKIGAHIFYRS